MKSRWIINLLLLVAIAILGVVAHFEPGIETPQESPAITSLKQTDVHRIHINRPIRNDVVLVRQADGQWLLERTTPLPAEDFKVRALTRLAEQKPVRTYAAADMDLAALQLDPPYANAILNGTTVEFGNLEPIDDLRYIRVGNQVHLIPDSYLQLMEASFTQFVRQRLFDKGARITALRLPGLRLTHEDKGWRLDPVQDIDTDVIQTFIEIWENASSLNVQAADPDKAGEPVEVLFEGSDTPVMFQIISREPELVLVRPDYGIQYRMGNRSEAMLTLDAAKADVKD
jgi:hypothetical protein